jgi:cytoskeleton protein RodZ
VSLEEVSRSTRIPTRYLEALESEQFSSLPAPVFIRGFIRAYCQAIGHPAEEALAFYHPDGEPETPHARPAPRSPARPGRARGAVAVSLTLVVVLGVALFGVTRFLQYGRDAGAQVTASRSVDAPARTAVSPPLVTTTAMEEAVSPPATSALPATVSSATPAPAPRAPEVTTPAAPAPVASSQPAQPPASSSVSVAAAPPRSADSARPGRDGGPIVGAVTSPYRLVARASETTWVKVRMDDGRSTEETIPAGETREWISNSPFVLTVGNAGGVSLELNGERLPPLGAKGVVVQRLVIPPQSQQ